MKEKASRLLSNREGAIIVLFAILLPVLVLILGFTVDYAYIQRSRNEARVVSDLAVKAAADTLARTGGDEVAALEAARFVAANNSVAGRNITLDEEHVQFGRAYRQTDGSYSYVLGDTPANAVQVIARRDGSTAEGSIDSFFGQFYARPTFNVAQLAQATYRDVEVMLVLDRSGSMKLDLDVESSDLTNGQRIALFCKPPVPTSRWIALDKAIDVFVQELRATPVQERIGMVTFSQELTFTCPGGTVHDIETTTLEAPLAQDLDEVLFKMDDLNEAVWLGGTNITAGLREARDHFESSGSPNVDKIIICLTDGVHNSPGEVEPFVEAETCLEEGITVHTITFSDGANQADMILTAQNGGGTHAHAPDEDALADIFRRLAGSVAFISK